MSTTRHFAVSPIPCSCQTVPPFHDAPRLTSRQVSASVTVPSAVPSTLHSCLSAPSFRSASTSQRVNPHSLYHCCRELGTHPCPTTHAMHLSIVTRLNATFPLRRHRHIRAMSRPLHSQRSEASLDPSFSLNDVPLLYPNINYASDSKQAGFVHTLLPLSISNSTFDRY